MISKRQLIATMVNPQPLNIFGKIEIERYNKNQGGANIKINFFCVNVICDLH
jgi:hypothetical protein